MATAQLASVVRHIQGLTADSTMSQQSDGALLRAYLGRNDQAAFAALLWRHGPMVLRICRRVLGNVHDAEDALQATFILLAQKATSIRQRESLVSWLHGVAYRMATHAKRASARRLHYESRVNPPQPPDPALCASWQELQALLDEEITMLPETLRAPFILCCLESKSCAETAGQLSLKESTVRNRLSRARRRLHERLTRRGVALTTALAAVTVGVSRASAAMPRSLVGAIVKVAHQVSAGKPLLGGMVSHKILALVEGVNQTMLLNKCRTVMLLLVCNVIVGIGLGLVVMRCATGAQPGADTRTLSPEAAREATKKGRQPPADAPVQAEAKDRVKLRGRVLDPGGKPVAGAKLYLGGPTKIKAPAYPVRATSGPDGRFSFSLPKAALETSREGDPSYQVLAVAEGYGCGWATIHSSAEQELTLRLVEDAPIKGRILDADGKPIAGAKLTVTGVAAKGNEGPAGARGWEGSLPWQPAVLTTGADGKFRLAGVGRDRAVHLRLEGRRIATARFDAQGAAFEYQAALSRPIHGMVRDKATRKPLAGVSVTNFGGLCEAVTDKEGRYELLGVAKAAHYRLMLEPAAGQLYF
jgi:RNA polymerase sigma factor (sigma-70 family)